MATLYHPSPTVSIVPVSQLSHQPHLLTSMMAEGLRPRPFPPSCQPNVPTREDSSKLDKRPKVCYIAERRRSVAGCLSHWENSRNVRTVNHPFCKESGSPNTTVRLRDSHKGSAAGPMAYPGLDRRVEHRCLGLSGWQRRRNHSAGMDHSGHGQPRLGICG